MNLRVMGAREEMKVDGGRDGNSRFTERFERRGARGRKEDRVGGEGGEKKSGFSRFIPGVFRTEDTTVSHPTQEYDIEKGLPTIMVTMPVPAVTRRADSFESDKEGEATDSDRRGGAGDEEGMPVMPVVAYRRGGSGGSRV